jgi:hypothetical protein
MKNKSVFENEEKVKYNPKLDGHNVTAPRKMAQALAFIEKNGLPAQLKTTKKVAKSKLPTLKSVLLNDYSIEPTEQQMLEIEKFLSHLFGKKINYKEIKHKNEVAA